MIHDDLERMFAATPQPSLSPEFSMNLRRRLRTARPSHGQHDGWRTWVARLYWLVAAALLAQFWRPVMLTPFQLALLVSIAVAIVLTLRRAARPGPLTRVLRQLWR